MLNDKITIKVGNTPLIKFDGIYLKMEMNNPSGSIKDRPAYNMLSNLMKENIIKEGDTIICPTSGNMGISLAYLSKHFSINVIIVLPHNSSKERIQIIESYGAKIIYSNSIDGMKGAIKLANKLAKENNYYYFDQFSSIYNLSSYYKLIEEIIDEVSNVNTIICGIGTGGTYIGLCKYIKDHNLNIDVIGYEPSNIPLISNMINNTHDNIDNSQIGIPGTGSTQISNIILNNVNYIDKVVTINPINVRLFWQDLIKDNLNIGISGAGAIYLALQNKSSNRVIVAILPDGIDRYSSDDYV